MKTPQLPSEKLTNALGLTCEVWLKREDKHHYGSHKGRSIPPMIAEYVAEGKNNFVISSSGNAAIAAGLAVSAHNKNKAKNPISLNIFIGKEINPDKKQKLEKIATENSQVKLSQVDNPKQSALQAEKTGGTLLRQSTDEKALTGYAELAGELAKIPNLSAVFIPTSSGTTAEGLYRGFQELKMNPEIHIIQTSSCHPIASEWLNANKLQTPVLPAEKSTADAIVDIVGHRKAAVVATLTASHGAAWIASNEDIAAAQKAAHTSGLELSPTSALSLVGIMQAQKTGRSWPGSVVCLITGA